MAEGAGQEGFFWETSPWVMSGSSNSSGGSGGGGGSEDRSSGDKKLRDLSMRKCHSQRKNPETGDMDDGSSGRGQEVAVTTVKKNDGGFEIKKEIKPEDDTKVSLHNVKAKRGLVPSDHDLHIWTERERRKKMRNMFHQLHALMPQLSIKADKSSVVDEAVRYIKTLQQTLQRLETKKLEKLYGPSTQTSTASLVQPQRLLPINTRESVLADQASSTGHTGKGSSSSSTSLSFPLCSPKVFQTWVSSNVTLNVCGRDAHISVCSPRKPGLLTAICFVLEKHKLEIVSTQISSDESKILFMIHTQANNYDKFTETFHYDEIYKQAATEITHWVNSKSS